LTKSGGLRPSEVGGLVLILEGDNKPIEDNGGAVFFVVKRDRMAEFGNGKVNMGCSWYWKVHTGIIF